MNLLSTRPGRIVLFASLYASEGAPIGFIWWALPTLLRSEGVAIETVGAISSILVLPWALKFLWSPFIDTVRNQWWTLKSWILTMQVLMAATLVPLVLLPPNDTAGLLLPLLLAHAFFASSQDAAIDALAIAEVPEEERGALNGWMQAGMLVGRSLFGGGALVLASLIGSQAMIAALIGMILWSGLLLLFFADETRLVEPRSDRFRLFITDVQRVARLGSTWWGLAFAVFAGAAFEGAGAVAGPFLIDAGMGKEQVGYFFALPAVVCMGFGAVAGGTLADRIGIRIAVRITLAFMSAMVMLLGILAAQTVSLVTVYVVLGGLYLSIGLFTASSYALFMALTDRRLGATQFSAFMGATNLCESWSAFAAGRVAGFAGYPIAFALLALVSLTTLPFVNMMKTSRQGTR